MGPYSAVRLAFHDDPHRTREAARRVSLDGSLGRRRAGSAACLYRSRSGSGSRAHGGTAGLARTRRPGLPSVSSAPRWAHLNLVSIHPWRDGNGRMSRAVHTLVLAREGVLAPEFSSIEEWLGSDQLNTMEYYAALQAARTAWQPERDARPWLRFCLRTHHLQAQSVQRRFAVAQGLWFRLEEIASAHHLGERTITALYAATTGELRRTYYMEEEDLTRDQSLADLRTLRTMNLIEPVGHARTQRYIGGPALRAARREVQADVHKDFFREPYPDI